jgi:putative lipoprotein (rSAM/lipoprotein system)
MKQKARHLLHLLLGALLGALGFSSCGFIEIGGGRCEYGEPHVDFEAAGKVTDKAGKGIEGIRVAIRQDGNNWYRHRDDTLYTDKNGQFEMKRGLITVPDIVHIVFEDIDGEANGGTFASQTVINPEIKQTKKGDGNWYNGAFAVKADVKLEKE